MRTAVLLAGVGVAVGFALGWWTRPAGDPGYPPASDPERTFVIFMCAYAADVLSGELPGPYTAENARRYARACLIPPELLERVGLDIELAAPALGLPVDEMRAARAEHARRPVACTDVSV